MSPRAAIVLGSNIDAETNLPIALEKLRAHPRFEVEAVSSTYETDPIGPPGQPTFLNAAVVMEVDLAPEDIRAELRLIEEDMGRIRTADRYAARPIDLDLVLYDDLTAQFADWQLPAPDTIDQPHVLVPLAEVAPDWIHPTTGLTLGAMAKRLSM